MIDFYAEKKYDQTSNKILEMKMICHIMPAYGHVKISGFSYFIKAPNTFR